MTDLFQRSVEIILQNQDATGAYLASPNFATYRHSWFRDGAYIAYAMNLVNEHSSAACFHDWAAGVVNMRADVVRRAITKTHRGEPLSAADILHTRYSLNRKEVTEEEWPNFQLDGFGTWLWALGEHHRLNDAELPNEWQRAAELIAEYLTALWSLPCYDCWEEFPDRLHTYTLAAIYGGLQAHMLLTGADHQTTLADIARFLREQAVADGHFVKLVGSRDVDANLLGLATPYNVVAAGDPRMRATVDQMEATLHQGGGLHRYAADTYYGGGEWVLLTAWLGWYYVQIGELEKAETAKSWVEAQADARGQLPEQVAVTLNDPAFYPSWLEQWGDIASPLLWSHAKYIILSVALHESRQDM